MKRNEGEFRPGAEPKMKRAFSANGEPPTFSFANRLFRLKLKSAFSAATNDALAMINTASGQGTKEREIH